MADHPNPTESLKKGIELFKQGDFTTAKKNFETALNDIPKLTESLNMWIRKTDAELQGLTASVSTAASTSASSSSSTPVSSTPAPAVSTKIRHEWYQTPTHVNITIFAKNVSKDQANIQLEPRTLHVSIKLSNSNDYCLDLDLFDEINTQQSQINYLSTKIELKLKKANNSNWDTLEADLTKPAAVAAVAEIPTTTVTKDPRKYPSSKGTDFDAIAAQVKKSEEEEKPTGDAALQSLFQQIYGNASDEQRQAMIKSYTESGGTVLSTNWDEVGKKKVEVSPPTGMVAKTWKDE